MPACPAYQQAGGRQESKNRDKLIYFIVRVIERKLFGYLKYPLLSIVVCASREQISESVIPLFIHDCIIRYPI